MIPQLSPAEAGDTEFLYQVYAGTRQDEVAAWGLEPVQQAMFLRMQFEMQRRAYALQFPGAEEYIISLEQGERVGRLILYRMEGMTRIVDIALLPQWRDRGIGNSLLTELQREAAASGSGLCLNVWGDNPAQHLYRRLGFVITAETGTGYSMEWHASA